MEKFFSKIRPLAPIIGLGLLALHLIMLLIFFIGAGVGVLQYFCWIAEVLLVGSLAFAYFTKRDQLLKVCLALLLAYHLVQLVFVGTSVYGGAVIDAVAIKLFNIFTFFISLAVLALFVLRYAIPNIFDKPLYKLILLAGVALATLMCIINCFICIGFGAAQGAAWTFYFLTLDQYLIVPAAFLFGVFVFEGH